jgi:sporulation protein YlmC with PRC-barrel domain
MSDIPSSIPVAATARRELLLAMTAFAGTTGLLVVPSRADQLVAVDVRPLAEAYRASRMIGTVVLNDKNEKIGTVDDLIVSPNDRVLFAVLSVGGFLGINRRLVAVPYSELKVDDEGHKIILPGASKDVLSNLPAFHYA